MYKTLQPVLQQELADIESAGLYKRERIITSPQGADITVQGGKKL
jgi:glycine C-acetyltransferase